jgi:hypothetical protein
LRTIFLAHAAADGEFVRGLSDFLEFGCDITCYTDAGLLSPGQDLIDKAEEGLASNVLALVLSPASCPVRWQRDRWEAVLRNEAQRSGVDVVSVLLADCPYPPLLRKQNFFDATTDRRNAMRRLKRWVWRHAGVPGLPDARISGDLEECYARLADQAGAMDVSGAAAERFVCEALHEFEAVLWVPCQGRTLAQVAGDLGAQLGLHLDRTAKENCVRIREFLRARRCLVVLDAPTAEVAAALRMDGRTSTLRTAEPVRPSAVTPPSTAQARALAAAGRFAEAYEMFYALLDDWVDTETCARELTWICEHWDRIEEANALRFQYGRGAAEQLALF